MLSNSRIAVRFGIISLLTDKIANSLAHGDLNLAYDIYNELCRYVEDAITSDIDEDTTRSIFNAQEQAWEVIHNFQMDAVYSDRSNKRADV